MRRLPPSRVLTALLLLAALQQPLPAAETEAAALEFFEKKVRPVLVEHCYKCHSAEAKSPKGGLRLDTRDAIRKGGDSGPAVVPGKPEASHLLRALRHDDPARRMPPKEPLPTTVIADLERWIAAGAADPRGGAVAAVDPNAGRRHWAFQPLRPPTAPEVRDRSWPANAVDAFILAKLESSGLAPSPAADRRTLLRRVTYDLLGLPPAPEAVDAFLADPSPDAYERLVDRLLASPQHGERWGRHWLDVARFADTKDGVLMYGDDRVRPYAYTYRDYVVRAFNADLPFDRFVHEQLAADRLGPTSESAALAAMGFLTLGRQFDNNAYDVLDDRIDVVTRGLLGLTVSCARCHDHKYDPIPTADYYSLYGVFASAEAPLVPPLLDRPENLPGLAEFDKTYGPKRRELEATLDRQFTLLSEAARSRVGDYLLHVATTPPDPLETAIFFLSLAPEDLRPPIIARWRTYLETRVRPEDPVFGPWHALFALPETDFATGARAVLSALAARPTGVGPGQVNPLVREALAAAPLTSRADVARAYGALFKRVYDASKGSIAELDAPRRQVLEVVIGRDSPAYFPKAQTSRYMSRADKDAFGGKVQELDRLAVKATEPPPRAMVLYDAAELHDPRILVRGNPARPGAAVPRQFLAVASVGERRPFTDGGGRLDLAKAITAPENPLTARVLANRVWMHHFGEPLVDNPSDFGLRTPRPVQAELLDHLAGVLLRGGWSLKRLHREILLSRTYQQASRDRADGRRADPENRLLWRMNRRRLELEAMRDGLLCVSGRLDVRLGGRPVDAAGDPKNRRRTVYGLVDRQSLPGLYRAFDFASPDQSAERRPHTTVPQQALFGMNAPFVAEQARALAARPEVMGETDPSRRIEALYHLVLQRRPDPDEVRLGLAFLAVPSSGSGLDAWGQYAQVLLLTNEAVFVD